MVSREKVSFSKGESMMKETFIMVAGGAVCSRTGRQVTASITPSAIVGFCVSLTFSLTKKENETQEVGKKWCEGFMMPRKSSFGHVRGKPRLSRRMQQPHVSVTG